MTACHPSVTLREVEEALGHRLQEGTVLRLRTRAGEVHVAVLEFPCPNGGTRRFLVCPSCRGRLLSMVVRSAGVGCYQCARQSYDATRARHERAYMKTVLAGIRAARAESRRDPRAPLVVEKAKAGLHETVGRFMAVLAE